MAEALKYEKDCHGSGGALGDLAFQASSPEKAEFAINQADAVEILRLADYVHDNGLYKVVKYDFRVSWMQSIYDAIEVGDWKQDSPVATEDEENLVPMRTDGNDYLNITADRFWFTCYRKGGGDMIFTEQVLLSEIAAHFGLPFEK